VTAPHPVDVRSTVAAPWVVGFAPAQAAVRVALARLGGHEPWFAQRPGMPSTPNRNTVEVDRGRYDRDGTTVTNHLMTVSMLATEVDDIETAIVGLPLTVRRLTTRDGGVGFTSTVLGETGILAGEFGFPVTTCGDVAGGSLVVALQLEQGSGYWNGEDFALDRAWIYRPGSEHVGVGRADHGHRPPRFATVSIPVPMVGPSERRTVMAPGEPLVSVVDDDRVRMLRAAVIDILGMSPSVDLIDERARLAQRDLIEIVTALDAGIEEPRVDRRSAVWITQECIALADSLDPMPATVDLARAVGVSDRWVRAAFRTMYGVSASRFFQARAMDGARRQLQAASPGSVTVTEVAMRCGFWHLSRFSATYREYFGELPSETLARVD